MDMGVVGKFFIFVGRACRCCIRYGDIGFKRVGEDFFMIVRSRSLFSERCR